MHYQVSTTLISLTEAYILLLTAPAAPGLYQRPGHAVRYTIVIFAQVLRLLQPPPATAVAASAAVAAAAAAPRLASLYHRQVCHGRTPKAGSAFPPDLCCDAATRM